MWDALRACLSELKHGGTKSTETHGGVGDSVGPADRARRVWCGPEATIGAPGSSCVFVSSVAPCFNLLRTRSGSQLIPDRTSAGLLRCHVLTARDLGAELHAAQDGEGRPDDG